MSIHKNIQNGDTVYFWFAVNDTSGSGNDGASALVDVRLGGAAASAASITTGVTSALLTDASYPAGCYEIAVNTTTGYAAGNEYGVFATITADSQNPTGFVGSFSTRPIDANLIEMDGVAQSATDLKDFADAGYDPAANKVEGVKLADTTTTNTDMITSATVNAACDTAMTDYDAATGTELAAVDTKIDTLDTNVDTILTGTPATKYIGPVGPGVYIDSGAANTNTVTGTDGIVSNPVSTFTAAATIAGNIGVKTYYLVGNSTLTLAATHEDWTFYGMGLPAANTIDLGSQDVDRSEFLNLTLEGTQGGTGRIKATGCALQDISGAPVTTLNIWAVNCGIVDDISLDDSLDNVFDGCYSLVAGNSAPIVRATGAAGNYTFRHYSGGIDLRNLSASHTVSIETDGQVIFDASCNSNAVVAVRGNCTITDNATMTSLTEDAVVNMPKINAEADQALVDIHLDHLMATSVADEVVDNSVIADLASSTGDWSTFIKADDSLQGIRDTGSTGPWTTGGGGSITQILNVTPMVPESIDLADTATFRIGLSLINSVDDLPTTAEITPGTISVDRKGIGGTGWSAILTDQAMTESAGQVYFDEVFNSSTGYAEGDSIRVTFKSVSITADTNTYEICDATGVIFYTEIRQNVAQELIDYDAATSAALATHDGKLDTAQLDLDTITGADGAKLLSGTQTTIDAAATAAALSTHDGKLDTAQLDLDTITGADGAKLLSGTQTTIDAAATAAALTTHDGKLDAVDVIVGSLLAALVVHEGSATSTSGDSVTLVDTTIPDTTNFGIGSYVVPTSGAQIGKSRRITAYNGTTTWTVEPAWDAAIQSGVTYKVVSFPGSDFATVDQIYADSRIQKNEATAAKRLLHVPMFTTAGAPWSGTFGAGDSQIVKDSGGYADTDGTPTEISTSGVYALQMLQAETDADVFTIWLKPTGAAERFVVIHPQGSGN